MFSATQGCVVLQKMDFLLTFGGFRVGSCTPDHSSSHVLRLYYELSFVSYGFMGRIPTGK